MSRRASDASATRTEHDLPERISPEASRASERVGRSAGAKPPAKPPPSPRWRRGDVKTYECARAGVEDV
jgi:hypothetical protein